MKKLILLIGMAFLLPAFSHAQKKTEQKNRTENKAQTDSLEFVRLQKEAKAGNAAAQNSLGVCYYTGKGVKKDYEAAAKWWATAAQNKNTKAIGNLAICYKTGNGVEKDSLTATRLFIRGIQAGDTDLLEERIRQANGHSVFDMVLMGICYQKGHKVKQDENQAIAYFRKASEEGSIDAARELSVIYLNNGNYREAYPLLERVSATGDLDALYNLGCSRLKGLGCAKDETSGFATILLCARKGMPKAQLETGDLYHKGIGVEKNDPQAFFWYKQAATGLNPQALWNVGICYLKGIGTDTDYHAATDWLAMASQYGFISVFNKNLMSDNEDTGWKSTPYYNYIAGLYHLSEKSQNTDEAFKQFSACDKQKVKGAKALMARCYLDQTWKKYNIKKAVKLLKSGEKENDPLSFYQLALLYENGSGVEKDSKKALELLNLAADAGCTQALSRLGDLYFEGAGVEQDGKKAAEYYQKALINQGLPHASMKKLASLFEFGNGVKKDTDMAEKLKKRATKKEPLIMLWEKIKL